METVKEKVERFKAKAELFLETNTRTFIVDAAENYYFCIIISIGEDYLYVEHFTGKKKGERERILWFDVIKFEEYKEVGE